MGKKKKNNRIKLKNHNKIAKIIDIELCVCYNDDMAKTYNYYYLGKEADEIKNIVLLDSSKILNGKEDKNISHSHAYVEIFIFESGGGVFECGKESVQICAGDVVMIEAGKKHVQYPGKDGLVYYSYAVIDMFVGDNVFPSASGYIHLSGKQTENILIINELCQRELKGGKEYAISIVSSLVKQIIVEILRSVEKTRSKKNEVDEVKAYLQKNYDQEITLEQLSKIFFTNKSTLLHTFKKNNGTSPLRYLNLYRIEMAKKLLSSGKRITETAILVGFSNPVYFAELFKKNTGLTPSAFKKWAKMIGWKN